MSDRVRAMTPGWRHRADRVGHRAGQPSGQAAVFDPPQERRRRVRDAAAVLRTVRSGRLGSLRIRRRIRRGVRSARPQVRHPDAVAAAGPRDRAHAGETPDRQRGWNPGRAPTDAGCGRGEHCYPAVRVIARGVEGCGDHFRHGPGGSAAPGQRRPSPAGWPAKETGTYCRNAALRSQPKASSCSPGESGHRGPAA